MGETVESEVKVSETDDPDDDTDDDEFDDHGQSGAKTATAPHMPSRQE